MALIKCPECKREISDKASSCPNCGFPLNNIKNETDDTVNIRPESIAEEKSVVSKKKKIAIAVLALLMFVIIIFSAVYYNNTAWERYFTVSTNRVDGKTVYTVTNETNKTFSDVYVVFDYELGKHYMVRHLASRTFNPHETVTINRSADTVLSQIQEQGWRGDDLPTFWLHITVKKVEFKSN